MKYVLLTGSTGLVGRYLMRDLLANDLPVAVVCRSNRVESATQRVEAVMARWEGLSGRSLRRPVVLEGDLRQPLLGLDAQGQAWVQANCDVVLHNAASMMFREDKEGEPFRTNVDGMRHVLALCRHTGIRKFHHVSTAYICGLRTGRVFEHEVDLGQQNGNVYEQSKIAAEKLVREADFLDPPTIYRPASVVGDSLTGYTTSSHGFYLPLQLAYVMADKVPTSLMGERFFRLLGLRGDEGKNLVPVDWLSAAIVELFTHTEHHGRTYHLTNPRPVTVQLIQQVVQEAIEKHSTRRFIGSLSEEEIVSYENLFRHYLEIYRSHWRDDPTFDRSNTDAALPNLPCPEMDRDAMLRVASYPVLQGFVLNRIEPVNVPFWPQEHLRRVVGSDGAAATNDNNTLAIEISGLGGGQWRVGVRDGRPVALTLGAPTDQAARCYLSAGTLASLVERRASVEQSILAGRIVIEGPPGNGSQQDVVRILKQLVLTS